MSKGPSPFETPLVRNSPGKERRCKRKRLGSQPWPDPGLQRAIGRLGLFFAVSRYTRRKRRRMLILLLSVGFAVCLQSETILTMSVVSPTVRAVAGLKIENQTGKHAAGTTIVDDDCSKHAERMRIMVRCKVYHAGLCYRVASDM